MTDPRYGHQHQQMRKLLILDPLKRDGSIRCVTCGRTCTSPDQVDLGHTDDASDYIGPQCVPCNRGDGATRGNKTRLLRPVTPTFRQWG